jgi:hypothetical protein
MMAGGGGRGGSVLATASSRPGLQATRIGPTGSREGSKRIRHWRMDGKVSSPAAARVVRRTVVAGRGGAGRSV